MMRVGIFGAGSIGNHLAFSSRKIGAAVTVCDTSLAALERFRNEIYPSRYGVFDSEIQLVAKDSFFNNYYDVIFIGTPPDSHLNLLKEAISAKPKIICIEKPVSTPNLSEIKSFAEILKTFSESDTKFLIFKPHSLYKREYFNNMCIDNFLAGMIGFKKEQNTILNTKIWVSLLKYTNYYYEELYVKNTSTELVKEYKNCPIPIKIDSPFYYGFEESALTPILSYLINKFNINVLVVPITFEYAVADNQIIIYSFVNNIFKYLTNELLDFFAKPLNMNDLFTNYKNLFQLYTYEFSVINIILNNVIYHLYFNKIEYIYIDGKNIKCFKDINNKDLKSVFNVLPFISGYTFDYGETIEYPIITNTYGYNISTRILNIIDLFEKGQYAQFKDELTHIGNITRTNNELMDTKYPVKINNLIKDNILNINILNNPIDTLSLDDIPIIFNNQQLIQNTNSYNKKYLKYKKKYLTLKNKN
jgi:hypothetical protein